MAKPRLELFTFQTSKGRKQLETYFYEDSVWLTLEQISELLSTTPEEVLKYLKKVSEHKGLQEEIISKVFLVPNYSYFFQSEKEQKYYNLDAILAVGYQLEAGVTSVFREWSTKKSQDPQVKSSSYEVSKLYIIQALINLFFAVVFAFSLQIFTDQSSWLTLVVTAILLLIGLYNIIFDAMRYQEANRYR